MASDDKSVYEHNARASLIDEYGYQVPVDVLCSDFEGLSQTLSAGLDADIDPIDVYLIVELLADCKDES